MKAMILAAGRGERLRPLTDSTPKPLLEVSGKPLIVYHLEALSAAGFQEVVINLSWLGEQIRERLGNGGDFNLRIDYSEEAEALETAGGIIQALDRLGEQFVIVNADIYTDYDFSLLRKVTSLAHLVLVANPQHHSQGDFSLRDATVGNQLESRFTYSGIACFQRSFFEGRTPGKQALAPLLRAGADAKRVTGELFEGEWTDIGTRERLQSLTSGTT